MRRRTAALSVHASRRMSYTLTRRSAIQPASSMRNSQPVRCNECKACLLARRRLLVSAQPAAAHDKTQQERVLPTALRASPAKSQESSRRSARPCLFTLTLCHAIAHEPSGCLLQARLMCLLRLRTWCHCRRRLLRQAHTDPQRSLIRRCQGATSLCASPSCPKTLCARGTECKREC